MSGWEEPDPAEVIALKTQEDWAALRSRYAPSRDRPLERCLAVAQANSASTVVVETRYIDSDYRSEFSAFHSKTFAPVADTTHRLHFFRSAVRGEHLGCLPDDPGYLGYVVVRPPSTIGQVGDPALRALGVVGRTMLSPPPDLRDAVRALATDRINFFGQTLEVEATPFMEQDTRLLRCAHVAAWMCHHTASLRGESPRRDSADFALLVTPSVGFSRLLPSEGLTVQQMIDLLRSFELPTIVHDVRNLPSVQLPWSPPPPAPPSAAPGLPPPHPGTWDTRIISTCCRYLNSGYPVLVTTADHAFVLCGYARQPRQGQPDRITFVRHDDQRGPYLTVQDVFDDFDAADGYTYTPWNIIMAPLPEKLWLPSGPAEVIGATMIEALARRVAPYVSSAQEILNLISTNQLAIRTYAARGNEFKASLPSRGLDASLIREYRLARLSRYIWVVEAIDRRKRSALEPCVLGEAVLDATSSELDPNILAVHVPGVALVHRIGAPPRFPIPCDPAPYLSGGVGPP